MSKRTYTVWRPLLIPADPVMTEYELKISKEGYESTSARLHADREKMDVKVGLVKPAIK